MADCIGTDCKREGLQAEVERLRGIVQADLEEKAEAWGEVERLRGILQGHNAECESLCKSYQHDGHCKGYVERGLDCPDCPMGDVIEYQVADGAIPSPGVVK